MRDQLHLYHSTTVDRIPIICQEGLQPSEYGHRDSIEDDLRTIAAENETLLPIIRQNCVFCYLSLRTAMEVTAFDKGEPDTSPTLCSREGIVVIEADSMQNELYIGDFDLFSDAIDLQFMDEPDHAVKSESYEDALTSYAESLTKLTAFESTDQINDTFHTPEILLENGVSNSRIVETVLVKQILRTKFD